MNKSKIIKEITQMGFNEQLVEKALTTNDNNSVQTIELLKHLKRRVSKNFTHDEEYYSDDYYSSDSDKDPLDILRKNSQFSETREDILNLNLESINSILAKDIFSKYCNKELLENISLNQEMFLKLMTDRKTDNVATMSCDVDLNDSDNLVIEKMKELGFPESEIVQAYFAYDRDATATLNFLNNNV